MKKLEKDKNKIIFGVVNREWDDYILENCHPNSDDLVLFEPFEILFKDTHKKYICYKYEITSTFFEGDYFGDFSLDEDKIIRNETIRAEENTFMAWITNEEYANIVSPSKREEKKKEILILNNSYFFKTISERIFKKNYYEMFVKKEYGMNTVLFNSGEKPKSLIFLKKGKISLILKCSIIELYNLIQLIYVKLNKISWPYDAFQKKILAKENLKAIEKKYFSDSIFKKIKTFNKIFKMELEKKRKFEIALFSDIEIIGLEEIYLKMPYISKGIVDGDKIICYELPVDKFDIILQEEIRNITEWYVKASINRILSLMERLHNLKQNYINIARIKSETAMVEHDILNLNNSVDKNKEKMRKYRNKNIQNSNRLNINNSKTLIPTNISFKKNDDYLNKTDNNDSEGNSLNYSKKRKNSSSFTKRKSGEAKSKSKRISSKKFTNILKSATKIRNNRYELEKNELKMRAGSVKLSEFLKRKNIKNFSKTSSSKNDHIIIIGNTKINLRKLKRKIKESVSINELIRSFEENENNNSNDSKDINNMLFSKDIDYIKIEEKNKNKLIQKEELNDGCIQVKEINTVKKEKINSQEKSNISNSIHGNEYSIKKNKYNSIDLKNNKIKKINYSKVLIKPISFFPISSVNNRNIFYKKNINEKININKQYLTSNTNSNNISLINQTSNSIMNTNNNTNTNTPNLSILPKIQQKSKYTEYIAKTPNFNLINKFKKKTTTGRIPEIVKDYYSQIKKRGYIPLIGNKESNTIFLRKYRRKYNDAEESQTKNLNKNEKILPKII